MSFTKSLVVRLRRFAGYCPTCGGPGKPLRDLAKLTGVSAATLSRFLHGRPVISTHLDKIERFILRQEKP